MLYWAQSQRRGRGMLAKVHSKLLLGGVCLLSAVLATGQLIDEKTKPDEKAKQEAKQAESKTADDARVSIVPRTKHSDAADKDKEDNDRRSNIRIDTTLVQIPVSVTDPLNRFVT